MFASWERLPLKNHIHMALIQSALSNIWCHPQNLIVPKLEPTIFKIMMDKEEDHRRILKGSLLLHPKIFPHVYF